jgi:hypothetical protein
MQAQDPLPRERGSVKSLLSLTLAVCQDLGALCGVDTTRDQLTITRRFEEEGDGFLTITLPTFSTALEGALESGRWVPGSLPAFRRRGALPCFLRGFADRIFDEDGAVRDDASPDCIYAIRQVSRLHSKVFAVCEAKYEMKSFDGYVECEEELADMWYDPRVLDELGIACARVFGEKLARIDLAVFNGDVVPRHGPGATADRAYGNRKFDRLYWTERLEQVAPAQAFLSARWLDEEVANVALTPPGAEIPCRVVSVPKRANSARVIAIEPTAVQYAQQAVLSEFKREFADSSDFVDLCDQTENQRMARRGSIGLDSATIDLRDASDRVGNALVERVFSRFPHLCGYLQGTRSTYADVPGRGLISLSKFASMGSATCFPVESIVFATIALYAVACSRYRTSRPSLAEYKTLAGEVRVFGDDIIVPTREAPACLGLLVALGAQPNPSKTFLRGHFRESCGRDYYRGDDVTVVYRRRGLPRTRRDVSEIVSTVSLRNQLYKAGLWGSAAYLDDVLRRFIPLPIVEETSPALGRISVFPPEYGSWDRDLHIPLVWGARVVSAPPPSPISGDGALLKCLLPNRVVPFDDAKHLERYGRPRSLRIKVGWSSAW